MKCEVCDNERFFTLVTDKWGMRWNCWGYDKNIYKCDICGLIFISPSWTKKELDKLYEGYTDQKDFPWQKQAVRLSKYLTKYIKKSHIILEIGCGKGENVKYLRNKGYFVVGIDKDSTYCDNINTSKLDYNEIKLTDWFDFIYAIQVFEHIDKPKKFIKKIDKILRKGGEFLLEFPNLEDPILSIYKVEKFEKFYYIPHHIFFWTPTTVKKLFNKLGIDIEIKLLQKYGILNHLRWIIFGVPGNWHPHIPILDDIYKWCLVHIFKKSDTIIVIGKKNEQNPAF